MSDANRITRLIRKATGRNIMEFVGAVLGHKYGTFRYRLDKGVLSLDDYHKILHATGLTFEELFPNPLRQVPRQFQKITIVTPAPAPKPPKKDKQKLMDAFDKGNQAAQYDGSSGMFDAGNARKAFEKSIDEPQVEAKKEPDPVDDVPFVDIYTAIGLDPDGPVQESD